jgi:hypothetical protein
MKLANLESAHIPTAKITNYLLDVEHREGGPKARFLLRFGFSPDNPEVLREALLTHCATHDVFETEPFEYGIKYRILGAIPSPDGGNPVVLVVWSILTGDTIPRLVTVIPQKEQPGR